MAFTLIELLVAIIAILIGLLLPAVRSVRDAAQRAQFAYEFRTVAKLLERDEHKLMARAAVPIRRECTSR